MNKLVYLIMNKYEQISLFNILYCQLCKCKSFNPRTKKSLCKFKREP